MRSQAESETSERTCPGPGSWLEDQRQRGPRTPVPRPQVDPTHSGPLSSRSAGTFRHESGLVYAPYARRAAPIRRRAHDVDRLLEWRSVQDQRLELAAFPARMDPVRLLKAEQFLDNLVIPSPAEPARVEAFRRDAGEGDVEAGLEIVVHQPRRIATPQRGEDPERDLVCVPIHPGVLVIRCEDRKSTRLNCSHRTSLNAIY